MFNKDLFLSLCEKYNVELSVTATGPMIKEEGQTHVITGDDVKRVFVPCQVYFGYSDNKINARVALPAFSLQEDYATAC